MLDLKKQIKQNKKKITKAFKETKTYGLLLTFFGVFSVLC